MLCLIIIFIKSPKLIKKIIRELICLLKLGNSKIKFYDETVVIPSPQNATTGLTYHYLDTIFTSLLIINLFRIQ